MRKKCCWFTIFTCARHLHVARHLHLRSPSSRALAIFSCARSRQCLFVKYPLLITSIRTHTLAFICTNLCACSRSCGADVTSAPTVFPHASSSALIITGRALINMQVRVFASFDHPCVKITVLVFASPSGDAKCDGALQVRAAHACLLACTHTCMLSLALAVACSGTQHTRSQESLDLLIRVRGHHQKLEERAARAVEKVLFLTRAQHSISLSLPFTHAHIHTCTLTPTQLHVLQSRCGKQQQLRSGVRGACAIKLELLLR